MKNSKRIILSVLLLLCMVFACTVFAFAAGSDDPTIMGTGSKITLTTELKAETGQKLVWETENKSLATVSKGKVTAKKTEGLVTITAKVIDSKTKETVIGSEGPLMEEFRFEIVKSIKSLKLSDKKISIAVGDDPKAVEILPNGSENYNFVFESANEAVDIIYDAEEDETHFYVSASEPLAKACNVLVKDTLSGKSAKLSVSVGVGANEVVSGMKPVPGCDPNYVGLILGKKTAFKATAAYIDPDNPSLKIKPISTAVTWETSDPEIATVDKKGNVIPQRVGECQIIARAEAGSGEYIFDVSVWPVLKKFELRESCDKKLPSKITAYAGADVFLWDYIYSESFQWGNIDPEEMVEVFPVMEFEASAKPGIMEIDAEESALLHLYEPGTVKVKITARAGSQTKSVSLTIDVKPFSMGNIHFEMRGDGGWIAWDAPDADGLHYGVFTNELYQEEDGSWVSNEDYSTLVDFAYFGFEDGGILPSITGNFHGIKVIAYDDYGNNFDELVNENLEIHSSYHSAEEVESEAALTITYDEESDVVMTEVTGMQGYGWYLLGFVDSPDDDPQAMISISGAVEDGRSIDYFFDDEDRRLLTSGYYFLNGAANYVLDGDILTYEVNELIKPSPCGPVFEHEHNWISLDYSWMFDSCEICTTCSLTEKTDDCARTVVLNAAELLEESSYEDVYVLLDTDKPVNREAPVIVTSTVFRLDGTTYSETYTELAEEYVPFDNISLRFAAGTPLHVTLVNLDTDYVIYDYVCSASGLIGESSLIFEDVFDEETGLPVSSYSYDDFNRREGYAWLDYEYDENGDMVSEAIYQIRDCELVPWQIKNYEYYPNHTASKLEVTDLGVNAVVEIICFTDQDVWWKCIIDDRPFGGELYIEYNEEEGFSEDNPYVYEP